MSRIAQTANFVAPSSGGIRTVLRHLAAGYAARGHDVVQVLPGPWDAVSEQPWGTLVTVEAPLVPGTGYRVLVDPERVQRILEDVAPDRLEVHDRTTLRGLGGWARRAGVPSLVVSHERLDRVLGQWLPGRGPARRVLEPVVARAADGSNRSLAAAFGTVVCTTGWAAEEFSRIGVDAVRVPLGVDLDCFAPSRAGAAVRARYAAPGEALLVLASRLSREKRPEVAVEVVAELVRRGRRVRLVVVGDGPAGVGLQRRARGLPVGFTGFLREREELAAVLACADVVLAPGPVETFGLAALEALACGTPVLADSSSAVGEVLAGAGLTAPGRAGAMADAVEELLTGPGAGAPRRRVARARAERFGWQGSVEGFLAVHGLPHPEPAGVRPGLRRVA
ncbi:glycosyltransferase family 1 protein [Kineococcus sp. NUM-3379]